MVGNHWLQTLKFEALEEILNQHSTTLTTLSAKMDQLVGDQTTLSAKMDKVVGDQERTRIRLESMEKAHLEVEQNLLELRHMH